MKRLLWIIPLVLFGIVLILILYLKFALPNVGSAPDITIEITAERIERGEYLANSVMSCVDCHSERDFTKYSGPIKGERYAGGGEEFTEEFGAPGNFYAPNLSPYYLGDWTDGEIYRALTSGVSKDGRALFPAMPYHLYGKASKEDIYAVIAYLRTLPEVENKVPESKAKFPFSLILNTIPQKAEHNEIPDKNNHAAYGEYITNLAACIDCHTPMEKGQMVMEKAFAGGREFPLSGGILRTSNITPHKEQGIGAWTEETFINRFRMYSDSIYHPHEVGDGFNTVMPWTIYANIKEHDLKAIYAYLQSLEPIDQKVELFTPAQ